MQTIKLGSKGNDVKTLQIALNLIPDGVFGKITHEVVVQTQRKHGLVADGVVGPKTWAVILSELLYKSKRNIDYIIIHCSDTPEGRNDTINDIRRWHTTPKPKGNGWSDIGYNYVIHLDGSIHMGRDINKVGAHCEGYNANSIGICYIGGKTADMKQNKDTRTPQQKEALLKLLKELRVIYPKAKIVGHRDLDKKGKTCPNFDAKSEYMNI
jgi:N-acetylmuramoyl-L-alanine amidase